MAFATAGTNPVASVLTGGRDTQLADLGNYFVAITPTPGTGIIGGGSVQAFTETTPILTLYNASSTKSIYPMFLQTHCTVVGATASVAANWTFTVDSGNRYTSGGTALTINNVNGGSTTDSAAVGYVGAITASAATGFRRIVGHARNKVTVIEVVGDISYFHFGGSFGFGSSTALNTTTNSNPSALLPPIVVGPLQTLVVVRWAAAQTTGSTYEYMLGFAEK